MSVHTDTVTVAYDEALDRDIVEALTRALPWVSFVPVTRTGDLDDVRVDLLVAAGPNLLLLDAIDAGVPCVVPTSEETRRYIRDGGGVLSGADAASMTAAVSRVVALAPAARRVMGRIGRNHLHGLVT